MAASTTAAPVRARRPRIFYGWWIVFAALIAQFVAIGTQAPVSGAFLVPMTEELGWARGEFAIATSVGTFVSAIIGFFVGGYVDRYGARPLMVIGATVIGGTLMAISRVEELWQFVLLRGVIFTLGFVLIGNLVVNVTVSKWFVRRRGWAISLASIGISLGAVVITPVMVLVVDEIGWRDAWMVMGVAAWVLIYPTALMMRRQPEDHGLLPDGAQADEEEDADLISAARLDFINSFTRGEAVRTLAMWFLVLAFGFGTIGVISVMFHAIPFMTDAGFVRSEAGLIFSAMGIAALLSKFAWGWLMQRFFPRGLAAISFVIAGGGVLLMLPAADSGSTPFMASTFFVFGWGVGGMIPLQEFIWASFFGRRHLGAVRSAAMPASIIFAAGGPVFAGVWNDVVGNYDGALLTFVGMWAIAAVLVMLARPPKLQRAPEAVLVGAQPSPGPLPAARGEPEPEAVEEPAPALVGSVDEPLPPQSPTPQRIERDYGLDANGNGASGAPPASVVPTLRLTERAGLVKPPLDPTSLDRVLPRQSPTVTEAAWEPTPEVVVTAPPSDVVTTTTESGVKTQGVTGAEFVAFEPSPRRERQRFTHEPMFDLSELERVPSAEPVFERTPEPDISVEAVTADEVIDPWVEVNDADPPADAASQPGAEPRPEPPPLRVETEPGQGRRGPRGEAPRSALRPPSSTRALEVSLGSAARALQRSLGSDGTPIRDILPAVAVGVATSAVTIGVVMMLRRGR